ncbi:MAG: hypothetical protein HKN86_00590 [Acidimicrobiia bacterium]|nr:hypothetical protein [Acidimicrobiia bacterium]
MLYFNNFANISYNFGDEPDPVAFQNISLYADIIDQIKDNITFANLHTIQEGFRADQVSIQLYDTPLHYWTFYLLNDNLREQGWPLPNQELITYIQKSFPNTTITTRESFASKFKIGQTITGNTSGQSGKVIRRNLDLGQIIVEGNVSFTTGGETFTSTNSSGDLETLVAVSSEREYLSESHYVGGDGVIVDIDPTVGPGALLTGKTHQDVYYGVNEDLKQIKVIKPDLINGIVTSFKKSLRG